MAIFTGIKKDLENDENRSGFFSIFGAAPPPPDPAELAEPKETTLVEKLRKFSTKGNAPLGRFDRPAGRHTHDTGRQTHNTRRERGQDKGDNPVKGRNPVTGRLTAPRQQRKHVVPTAAILFFPK